MLTAELPSLVRAAAREPVRHILDWFHLLMRIRPIQQILLGLANQDVRDVGPLTTTCQRHSYYQKSRYQSQISDPHDTQESLETAKKAN
jgi:hypothetical protein